MKDVREWSYAQIFAEARSKAVGYLNRKPCTKQQVVRYLQGKGFEREITLAVTAELEEYHYIDDLEYCRMYFAYGFEKGRGVSRIRRELAEKGVDSDVIDLAYDELEEVPDPFEMALSIGKSVIQGIEIASLNYDEKRKLQAKIGRRLASRGFSSEVAYRVIRSLT